MPWSMALSLDEIMYMCRYYDLCTDCASTINKVCATLVSAPWFLELHSIAPFAKFISKTGHGSRT